LKVEEIPTYQKNWKEHVERMQDGRFPKLALNTNQLESEAEVVPKKDGKTSSWQTVEENRINKPSQQFRKNTKI
jgi:hypothetical protein